VTDDYLLEDLRLIQREWVRRYGDGGSRPWLEWIRSLQPVACRACSTTVYHPRDDGSVVCGECSKSIR
jgi:hypothetical protein